MSKIVTILGARPQFIKASIVSKKINKEHIPEVIIYTGQHYDKNLSELFFKELNLPEIKYNLKIGSSTHARQTGEMLIKIEEILLKEKPDVVLVYGDTNSTLAGALAASKIHIPVAHVEAGLRCFNKQLPEEINRILTDNISDILFAPTSTAKKNLKKENITKGVYLVGDVMYDLFLEMKEIINEKNILVKFKLCPKKFILATIHRAENTDSKENLKEIWNALKEISRTNIKVIFPIHPRTFKALKNFNLLNNKTPDNLILIQPISYKEMFTLEKNAKLIITDSGGVQKEGYFHKTQCLIVRGETSWSELVQTGWNKLTGANKKSIYEESIKRFNSNISKKWESFYGQGDASDKVVSIIKNLL